MFQAVPLAFLQFVLHKTLECYFKDNDDVEKYEQYDQIYIKYDFLRPYKLYLIDQRVSWHPTSTGNYCFHPKIKTVTNKSFAITGLKHLFTGPPNHRTLQETPSHPRVSVIQKENI